MAPLSSGQMVDFAFGNAYRIPSVYSTVVVFIVVPWPVSWGRMSRGGVIY
jgi:hypothetical protein